MTDDEGVRLQKVLSQAGIASRRVAEKMIRDGRVEVDDMIVTEMGTRVDPSVSVIRVDGVNRLDFDYDELTDALGQDFDGSVFEEISSTHYGRMVHLDDRTMLFASPEDAADFIGFDLTASS